LRFQPPAGGVGTARGGRTLVVWAVSDGRAGIENQALGLAEALGRLTPVEIVRKHVRFAPGYDKLPTGLKFAPSRFLAEGSDPITPPWPDVWIGAGRAAMPFAIRMRRWSRGGTFVVQVQDPRWPPQMFDAVVPPRHDRVEGPNVISITGSPHRVTEARLKAELALFADTLDPLPQPRVAVLIGGKSKAFDISPERAARLAAEIAVAVEAEKGSVLVTFSRRTPEAAREILAARLGALEGVVWDGAPPNPYFAFLAAADYVLVTEDSTNMAAEAASTGKPVFILKVDGQSLKFRRFHEDLERLDAARPFGGALYRWKYEPLRETERAAAEILRRVLERQATARSASRP
jgi:hypothetical protein